MREHGDEVTRFDRNEPTLSTNLPNDPRDTTTPRAMAALMNAILRRDGKAAPLARGNRDRLLDWLTDCETGRERLRAGLPPQWLAADKTGTGERSAVNDIAILKPPRRPPIMVAAFLGESGKTPAELNPAPAAIAREIVSWVAAR